MSTRKLDDPVWRRERASIAGRSRTTPAYHLERVRAAAAELLPDADLDALTLGELAALFA